MKTQTEMIRNLKTQYGTLNRIPVGQSFEFDENQPLVKAIRVEFLP